VSEHGMSRWFRRFAEGVFDETDMQAQADDLAEFLKDKGTNLIALGYSNGANMGAALMTFHPEILTGLIMWRGMTILREQPTLNLAGKKILMVNGLSDQMGPIGSARGQAEHFRQCGADVTAHELSTGHGLTQADFSLTREWLQS
jgi:phospholipase/carboxylesterase